jgi:hypothetical protein
VVLETEESTIVVWHVRRAKLPLTFIPTVKTLGLFFLVLPVTTKEAVWLPSSGRIAVAKPGQVHGAMNTDSKESFIFVSVVAPGNAGFALAGKMIDRARDKPC